MAKTSQAVVVIAFAAACCGEHTGELAAAGSGRAWAAAEEVWGGDALAQSSDAPENGTCLGDEAGSESPRKARSFCFKSQPRLHPWAPVVRMGAQAWYGSRTVRCQPKELGMTIWPERHAV